MQALVLDDDSNTQAATAMALFKRNFQVVTAGDVEIANAYADLGVFDLVVMSERVRGRLSHGVALAAELRNPAVTTMMITPRVDEDVDELFELLPSLYCLLGKDLPPEMVAKMAVSGVIGCLTVADRAKPVAAIDLPDEVQDLAELQDADMIAEPEQAGAAAVDETDTPLQDRSDDASGWKWLAAQLAGNAADAVQSEDAVATQAAKPDAETGANAHPAPGAEIGAFAPLMEEIIARHKAGRRPRRSESELAADLDRSETARTGAGRDAVVAA